MIADKQNNAAAANTQRTDPSFTPRPRADRDTSDRFARSMQNEREKQEPASDKADKNKPSGDEETMRKLQRRGDDGPGNGGAGYAGDQVGLRQAEFVKATAQASMTGEALPAHLEKMAAAIQELAAKGVDAKFHLQLPLGPLTVQSAILGKDAGGNLAVQLQALGYMSPALMSRLSADLAYRLRQRQLRVGSVDFASAEQGQRVNPTSSRG